MNYSFIAAADSFADWDEVRASYGQIRAVMRATREALSGPKAAEKVFFAVERSRRMKTTSLYRPHALLLEVARVAKCVCTQWIVLHCLKTASWKNYLGKEARMTWQLLYLFSLFVASFFGFLLSCLSIFLQ